MQDYEALVRRGRKQAIFEATSNAPLSLGRGAIERLIPHREPFLLLDALAGISLERRTIVGRRHIAASDPIFIGHFPGNPIYPGVLQLEAMGQLGLCLFALHRHGRLDVLPSAEPADVRALKIHDAVFLQPVLPGDDLVLLAQVLEVDDTIGTCIGQVIKGESVCSVAVMEVYFVES